MFRRSEGNFRGHQQLELFYQTWEPENPTATLVVTHGLAEHSDCYDHFAQSLNAPNWSISAWDLRGHGRSEGKRGLVGSFSEYIEDLLCFLTLIRQRSDLPIVLFGHSMGGLVTLRLAVDHPELNIKALALSSPLLGIAVRVPPLKDYASRLLNKYFPEVTLYNEMKYEQLSRDPEMVASYRKDPLRHEKISPPLYIGMIENMDYVMNHSDQIKWPVLMQVAGHDMIVSTAASTKLFEQLQMKNKKLITYPESYHEIFNDLDNKKACADLLQFLKPFAGQE